MKNVLLSADSEISVYTVPDEVADNLAKYCLEFCGDWLHNSPEAARYRVKIGNTTGVCYTEKDFIDYLNNYVCSERSTLIKTLDGVYDCDELPEEYAGLPYFNF